MPLSATVAIATLLFCSLYIGENLEGFAGPHSDALKRLALQIAAKILVMFLHSVWAGTKQKSTARIDELGLANGVSKSLC